MKHLIFTISLIFLFVTASVAQTPTPTPTPPDDDVVKITTTLIQIDATVTDKKGNIVKDLKPEDFEVYENGKLQSITNFSFITFGSKNSQTNTENQSNKAESPKTPIPIPPVRLKPEQIRRTYAIVVDDLNLSFSSIFWVKSDLKRFVNEQMEEGDLVAILRVGTGLGALQSFTTDKRQLLVAIDKIRWNTLANPFSYEPIVPQITDEQPLDVSAEQQAKREEREKMDDQFSIKAAIDRDSKIDTQSLAALKYVINGMSELPGRKSIMFFSEGFQLYNRSERIPAPNKILNEMRAVIESATRASVVLYTFDPRGVDVPGATAEDDIAGLARQAGDNSQKIRDRDTRTAETIDSLRYLAEETGGIANLGNSINKGIEKVFNDQSYYLLGYQPDSETFDPNKDKFNKLEVRIKNPNLKIRYRSGFYGVSDEKLKEIYKTPQQKIYAAVSSPFGANEINLNLYPVFYNDSQNRNFIRTLVHIDAKDLTFMLEPDGFYKTTFEILAGIFDTNGSSANNRISQTSLRFSPENYHRVQKEGIVYNLETPIIVTGGYQFRVALRDVASDKVGSASQFIEVPDLKKKKLTLSQMLIRNYSLKRWNEILAEPNVASSERKSFLADTASREFNRGTVLFYQYVIYNTRFDNRTSPKLEVQTRLFQNGKLLMENEPQPLNIGNQKDLYRIEASNAVTLGTDLALGDYVLQIVVTDKNADKKKQMATQWIDFAIIQ